MSISLEDRLLGEMKEALKKGDKLKLSVIRLARSAIKNKEIEQGEKLSDDDVIGVLSSLVKKHKESIEQYRNGGRDDLASNEEAELAVLQKYLPSPLEKEELLAIVEEMIGKSNAKSKADIGKVMGLIMPLVRGRADGRMVKEMVESKLVGAV